MAKAVWINVLVTVIAVNMLTRTPIANVTAKPLTILAPKLLPNSQRMTQVIQVDMLESKIEVQARWKPDSIER